ncbi:MAG: efflux RND transporter periplasmic adaptor subunit [Candidatus Eremiobacteraeota bacterium]|nr:efflux RND transporter periplasmic adaptor subunit [Candidatus Eremiobacteraeota bacterium]
MDKIFKRGALYALGLVACAAFLGGCAHKGNDAQAHGPPALNVDVARATRQDIATFVTLDGQVAPLQESALSFQQSGPIVGIYVNEGDHVGAGQLLARVDASTLSAQLAQDEALIAQASARARSSSLSIPITQSQTSAAVQSSKGALDNAQLNYNQNLQLFKQGYVSQSQLEQSRSAFIAAQSQYRSAQANTGNTGISSANASADAAAVQSAAAQANTLRTQIGQTALYAPFAGTVTSRLMDPGGMAGPSAPVLRISKVDTVWINVSVPDEDLAYVHTGTPVTFRAGPLGTMYTGRVASLNAVPTQGTLSYRARIAEPNPGNALRGGMLVSVTIQKARHKGAVVVPRSAVAQTDQGASVFVVGADKTARQVPVQIGLQTDTASEVRSPRVRPGTVVITTRPDALQNGSVVAVSGAGPPGPRRHK